MATIVPIKLVTKKPLGPKKLYTIHKQHTIFTIQNNVLSFKKSNDAIRFARVLESHFDQTKEWPYISDDVVLFNTNKQDVNYLNIIEWYDTSLHDFCQINIFSLIEVSTLKDEGRFIGERLFWDMSPDMYIERFDNMYNSSS
jgi:hypothetical protein